jgi:hypothetical protein
VEQELSLLRCVGLSGNEEAPRRPATADGSSSQLDRSFFEIASKVPEFTLT